MPSASAFDYWFDGLPISSDGYPSGMPFWFDGIPISVPLTQGVFASTISMATMVALGSAISNIGSLGLLASFQKLGLNGRVFTLGLR